MVFCAAGAIAPALAAAWSSRKSKLRPSTGTLR